MEGAGTGACYCLSAGIMLGSGDQDTNLLVSGSVPQGLSNGLVTMTRGVKKPTIKDVHT